MKQFKISVLVSLFLIIISATSLSCSKKRYGCPGENAAIKLDKNGELPTKRGKSHLFNKETRKRIKRHKK